MINIEYSIWKKACDSINKIKKSTLKNSLQWYPISKLSKQEKDIISTEDFFNNYIKSGNYLMSNKFKNIFQYFLPKSDLNLRAISLINPIDLYFSTALGFYLNNKYKEKRDLEHFSVYYAGNLSESNITYNKPYDDFYKKINSMKDFYSNFIKIDLQNFYPSINVNRLIKILLEKCKLNAQEAEYLKDYFLYLGDGKFPFIENCATFSFIATKIYLEYVDIALTKHLKHSCAINDFYCVRYVDDLYIFFDCLEENLNHIKNNLIFELTSILQEYNLMYNPNKLISSNCGDIDEYLKHSFYGDECDKIGFEILDMFDTALIKKFLLKLIDKQQKHTLNVDTYNNIINEVFVLEGVEYSSYEIFRNFCFKSNKYLKNCHNEINAILSDEFDILKLDVHNLISLILETRDEENIKKLLNRIYTNIRESKYDKFNTKIIIQYLLKRGFANKEFINILKLQEPELFSYISDFCLKNFYEQLIKDLFLEKFNKKYFYKNDGLLMYLHNEYIFNFNMRNYLLSFGYFCSYFERLTAHIAFVNNREEREKKPNYKKYYNESSQKTIWNNDDTIELFRKYRNGVPFIHNDMKKEILDNSCKEINNLISKMQSMIRKKIKLG